MFQSPVLSFLFFSFLSFFFFWFFFSELGTEPRALCFLGKRSTTELNPQPLFSPFLNEMDFKDVPLKVSLVLQAADKIFSLSLSLSLSLSPLLNGD